MSSGPAALPALSPGVLVAPTTDGAVVYDLVTEHLSFLNATGGALMTACRDRRDLGDVCAEWAAASGVAVADVRRDVEAALDRFRDVGLVGRNDPPPTLFPPDAPVDASAATGAATTQAAGVHRIRFRSDDPSLVALVADLIGLASDDPPTADFHLLPEPGGVVRLVTDTEWRFGDRDELRRMLVTVVNDFVARTTTDAVLHAAALCLPTGAPAGAPVVFPAAPGSGKSTLAALLARHGWGYVADESTTVRHSDLAVVPCAKPVGLDATSCEALGLDPTLAGDVPLAAVAPSVTVLREPSPPPAALVIPTYTGPDGHSGTAALDADEALVTLVGNTLNLRYVGEMGLRTLVALVAATPVWTMAYRSGEDALAQLAALGFDS